MGDRKSNRTIKFACKNYGIKFSTRHYESFETKIEKVALKLTQNRNSVSGHFSNVLASPITPAQLYNRSRNDARYCLEPHGKISTYPQLLPKRDISIPFYSTFPYCVCNYRRYSGPRVDHLKNQHAHFTFKRVQRLITTHKRSIQLYTGYSSRVSIAQLSRILRPVRVCVI